MFVSYDGGRSKAFLDCSSSGLTSAGEEAYLEINHITGIDPHKSDAPVVAFLLGANTSAFWSIDAWGTARTDSDCQWRTDALGFTTTETAFGEDFGHATLINVKKEKDAYEDIGKEDKGTSIMRPNLRPGDANKHAQNKWDTSISIIQPRKAPSGKGKNKGKLRTGVNGDGDDNKQTETDGDAAIIMPLSVGLNGDGDGDDTEKAEKAKNEWDTSFILKPRMASGSGKGKGTYYMYYRTTLKAHYNSTHRALIFIFHPTHRSGSLKVRNNSTQRAPSFNIFHPCW
jgi:hypothetical protein